MRAQINVISASVMDKESKKRSMSIPYVKSKPKIKNKLKTKTKLSAMNMHDGVLDIHAEAENELLKSDSESVLDAEVSKNVSTGATPSIIAYAKNEMMMLLKEIRNSQSSQCTKNDLMEYSQTINKQFVAMDKRVSSNTSTIKTMEDRIKTIETTLESNKHESELAKQSVLSRNLSIIGVPASENEDLKWIALSIFSNIGCKLTNKDIFSCYRIKKGNVFTDIFIVKINDFAVKNQILKSKVNKEVRLKDVMTIAFQGNPIIYVNNHVTPFFGKLLAEGRKAVKEKKIHSVWLTRQGCKLRFEENGVERIYCSTDELYGLISSCHQRPSNQRKRLRSDEE